jgi:PAS domain S-box-containing protein
LEKKAKSSEMVIGGPAAAAPPGVRPSGLLVDGQPGLLEALGVAVYMTDIEGRITLFNEAAAELWGRRPEIGRDLWCGSWRLYHTDGSPMAHEACPMAITLKEGRPVRGEEIIVERPDGSRGHVIPYPTPLFDESGALVGAVNVLVDITPRKRVEGALQESELRYRTLFNSSLDAVFSFDLEGKFTSANPPTEELSGYGADELVGRSFAQYIVEEDRDRVFEHFVAIVAGESRRFETAIRHKDGRRVELLATGMPVEAGGRTLGVLGMARDVTEQKRAERAVRESEERFAKAFNASPAAKTITRASDRLVIDVNTAFVEMLGYARDEVIGRHVDEVGIWADDADRQRMTDELARNGRVRNFEARLKARSGALHDVLGSAEIITLAGEPSVLALFYDITDRKRAEQEIHDREERLRVAMEAGKMGAWEWHLATNEVHWSEGLERIHGLEPGTFEGTFEAYLRDVHPEDRDRLLREVESSLERGAHYVEYRIIVSDGAVRWVSGKGELVRDEAGNPVKLMGVCSDITERKRIEGLVDGQKRALEQIAQGEHLSATLETLVTTVERHASEELTASILLMAEDGQHLLDGAAPSLPEAYREAIHGLAIGPEAGSCGTAAYNKQTVVVADIETDPLWRDYRDLALAHGLRACWSTPLLSTQGDVLATFALYYRRPREPNPEDIELVRIMARTGSVAIERRRTEEDLARVLDRERFLAEASAILTSSLDYETTLQSIARFSVPRMADWCAVDIVSEQGKIERLAVAHVDPRKVQLAHALTERYPIGADEPVGTPKVLRTGEPDFYPDIPDHLLQQVARDDEHLQVLRQLGFRSGMIVPLAARGRTLGTLSLVRAESGLRYNRDDLAMAEDLGTRAALAIDNARLYRETQRANEAKDEFLGLVSHELRTPITTIFGGARVLRRAKALDGESQTNIIEDIEIEADRLHRIVEDLLVLARSQLGQRASLEPVLVQRVVDKVARHFRQHVPSRPLDVRVAAGLPAALAEPTYLEQILRNLLSNAEKYTPAQSPLEIEVGQQDGRIVTSVRDRGPGVLPDQIDAIFDRFYRAPSTAKAKGLGLGLTVCKRLIEAQSGDIWARPREDGGLEVGFGLPIYREEEAP